MKKSIIISLLIINLGCSNKTAILEIGRYKSIKPSIMYLCYQYMFNGIRSYTIGSDLLLQADSTFLYSTCGNVMAGTWKNISDSLFLNIKSNKFRNDSLNKNGLNGSFAKVSSKPIILLIENNNLIYIDTFMNGRKFIEIMKFNVP